MADRGVATAFVDDIFTNLHSVRAHAPDCLLINLMANDVSVPWRPIPASGSTKPKAGSRRNS